MVNASSSGQIIDPWHFARIPFTGDVHKHLVNQGSIRLFGPRRTGKTQFLIYDLANRLASYRTAFLYISFWQARDPLTLLIDECEDAAKPRTFLQWLGKTAQNIGLSAKISGSAFGGAATAELSLAPATPPAVLKAGLERLDQALKALSNPEQPAILLLDEFQELAKHPNGEEIIQSLSNMLQSNVAGLRAVFCGSSQQELEDMFKPANDGEIPRRPFAGFGHGLDLPPLPDEFVTVQCNQFHKEKGRNIDESKALAFFEDVRRNPQIFRDWLIHQGMNAHLTEEQALTDTIEKMATDYGFQRVFDGLTARNQALLRLIADGLKQPAAKSIGPVWTELTGQDAPSQAKRNNDLTTLNTRKLVDRDKTGIFVSDPAMGFWLRRLGKDTFAGAK